MLTTEQIATLPADVQAHIAALAAKAHRPATKLTMKVSEKGALSVYGMGRWPVTLYRSQWERLLTHKDELLAFIEANADTLAVKE